MFFNPQTVQLSRIDDDQTFRIRTEYDVEGLVASMQRVGLINSPVLKVQSGTFQIISGFRRIQAARALQWEHVPARMVAAEQSFQSNCLIAIVDNTAHGTLHVVEEARAIALLSRTVSNPAELIVLARDAGIHVNKDMIAKLHQVIEMPSTLQKGLIDGSIALPVALKLFSWIESPSKSLPDPEGAHILAELLLELNLSLNRQRELLDWVEAIIHRDAISITELLSEDPLVHWRNGDKIDRAHKSQKIREYFKYRRFPEISRVQDRFTTTLKQLALPPGIRMTPPPFFEGQIFSLQADFKNHKDLLRLRDEIDRIGRSPLLKFLLDPAAD